jgi:RNA polymerase sigma factor (sigma-70 family)
MAIMRSPFLKSINKIKNNLYEEITFHTTKNTYSGESLEQQEKNIAQKLLHIQAELLSFLYKDGILKTYCQAHKNHPLKEDDQFDSYNITEWNQLKGQRKIYFSDFIQMVEQFIKKDPFNGEKALYTTKLLNSISTLRNNLIRMFTPLVIYYAKKHYNISRVSPADLQQEGYLGLIQAVETFYYIGEKTSIKAYFSFFIKQQMSRFIILSQNTLHIPYMVALKMFHNINQGEKGLQNGYQFQHYYLTELKDLIEATDQDANLLREKEEGIIEKIFKKSLSQTLSQMLHTLSPTEKEVIILRYGVENNKEETLKSIASKYHISRERVRQIEKNGSL